MSCCLRHDLFQGISYCMTEDLKGMIVDNIKPQVDRFVFPVVHRVIEVASGRLIRMSPRSFRFHAVRTGTCRTILCRVHRYLLNSATVVCLMGHTAVLTSVPDCFLAVEATLFQVLIRQKLCYWPSVFRDVVFLRGLGAGAA